MHSDFTYIVSFMILYVKISWPWSMILPNPSLAIFKRMWILLRYEISPLCPVPNECILLLIDLEQNNRLLISGSMLFIQCLWSFHKLLFYLYNYKVLRRLSDLLLFFWNGIYLIGFLYRSRDYNCCKKEQIVTKKFLHNKSFCCT